MQHENKVKMDTKTAIKQGWQANGKHGESWADYSEDAAPAAGKGKKGRKGGKGGGKGGKQDKTPAPPKPGTGGGAQQKPELRSKTEMAEFSRFTSLALASTPQTLNVPKNIST